MAQLAGCLMPADRKGRLWACSRPPCAAHGQATRDAAGSGERTKKEPSTRNNVNETVTHRFLIGKLQRLNTTGFQQKCRSTIETKIFHFLRSTVYCVSFWSSSNNHKVNWIEIVE